jgi:membrane protease YdiL (CAAX protease family)
MTASKTILLYLLIAYAIIFPACCIALLLGWRGIQAQAAPLGLVFMAIGGISTAFSGAFVAKKSRRIGSYKALMKDFFCVKQRPIYYAIALMFLLIMFGRSILRGEVIKGQSWLILPLLFIRAILFGGIEEIGWCYLFQPVLQQKYSFATSSVITFFAWAVWHMMFNVLDGTIFLMDANRLIGFLMGLLGSSFILGCIYHITKSLWLCAFYHALLNAFSQTFIGLSLAENTVILIVSVALSVAFVAHKDKWIFHGKRDNKPKHNGGFTDAGC